LGSGLSARKRDVITLPALALRLREEPAELADLLESILGRLADAAAQREKRTVVRILQQDVAPDYGWPGNVRELEQAVKRIVLTGHYRGGGREEPARDPAGALTRGMAEGALNAETLLAGYCAMLYRRFGSCEEVSRRTQLDRRTVKKYVNLG